MKQPNEKTLKISSEKFRVSEVSNFLNITPRILKHYETSGVLNPSRTERNEYREYAAEDVIKIQTAEQLKLTKLTQQDIRDYFTGSLNIEKKRKELIELRDSITRLIELFDLELSNAEPLFYFTEETSLPCFCETFLLSGNVQKRYLEARKTYSDAIRAQYKCLKNQTLFYMYDNLFPLPPLSETDFANSSELLPERSTQGEIFYRVCVPVIPSKDNKPTEVITRKKSFAVKYSGEVFGGGKIYYILQNEAKNRGIELNGNVWSLSLTGPNKKTKRQTYTITVGAELK